MWLMIVCGVKTTEKKMAVEIYDGNYTMSKLEHIQNQEYNLLIDVHRQEDGDGVLVGQSLDIALNVESVMQEVKFEDFNLPRIKEELRRFGVAGELGLFVYFNEG